MHIPFVDLKAQYLSIKPDIDNAISGVINETAFIGGHYVKRFADDFALSYGVKHVIPCANGTDSLYIIMKMLGIGEGDEVITAANSWISSSETITQTGAKVVFADIHPNYFSIDENLLEGLITPRTKAVIAVHLHGQMCAIDKIKTICDQHGIFLIEDCAQSHFSELNDTLAGSRGIAGSFSFYPGKLLGAYGDAGCIITDNDELAEKCRMYANHGALVKHNHRVEGINSRLDGLQASILSAKLRYVNKWIEQRINNAHVYHQCMNEIKNIQLPAIRPGSRHTYHLYVILAKQRDALKKYLDELGIETSIHYPIALPFLEAYRYLNHVPGDFPVTAQIQQEILSLPMYPELTKEKIEFIAGAITKFYS